MTTITQNFPHHWVDNFPKIEPWHALIGSVFGLAAVAGQSPTLVTLAVAIIPPALALCLALVKDRKKYRDERVTVLESRIVDLESRITERDDRLQAKREKIVHQETELVSLRAENDSLRLKLDRLPHMGIDHDPEGSKRAG